MEAYICITRLTRRGKEDFEFKGCLGWIAKTRKIRNNMISFFLRELLHKDKMNRTEESRVDFNDMKYKQKSH